MTTDTESDYDKCPVCGKTYWYRCKCFLGDMVCPDGHEWHHCPMHGTVILGPADHKNGGMACICEKKEGA